MEGTYPSLADDHDGSLENFFSGIPPDAAAFNGSGISIHGPFLVSLSENGNLLSMIEIFLDR